MKVSIDGKQDTNEIKLGDVFSYEDDFYMLANSIGNSDKYKVTLLNLKGNTEWDSWIDMDEFLDDIVNDDALGEFKHYSQDDYEIVLKRK